MINIDKRNKLIEHPFSYIITNSDKVIIYRDNKQVMILKGNKAAILQTKLLDKSEHNIQLVLAKITGNYKRCNERTK